MSKTWTQAALDAPTDTSPAGSDLITFVDVSAGRTEQVEIDDLAVSDAFTGRYAPIFTPEVYGSVQAAINAAAATAPAIVGLRAGEVYNHTGLTISTAGIIIQGYGAELHETGGVNPHIDVTAVDVSILGVKVTGIDVARDSTNHGIRGLGADRLTVRDCDVSGTEASGIFITGSDDVEIVNNYVHGTRADAIHVTNQSTRVLISGNRIGSSNDDGIGVVGYQSDGGSVSDVIISNNIISSGVTRGIALYGVNRATVVGNRVKTTNSAGIILGYDSSYNTYGCSDVTIVANQVEDCNNTTSNGGIYVNGNATYPSENIVITKNTVRDSAYRGVVVANGGSTAVRSVSIEGNVIDGSAQVPIYCTSGTPLTITGNMLTDCADSQIVVIPSDSVMEAFVRGNTSLNPNPTAAASCRFFNAETATFEALSVVDNHAIGGTLQSMLRCPSTTNAVIHGNTRNGAVAETFTGEPAIGSRGTYSTWSSMRFSGYVGFYGTTPAAKPTVTGSRGGNAALASLLTALSGLGLVTDSSS